MGDRTYPNSGALFKNRNKTSAKAPDYYGEAEIGGKPYKVVAWIKDGRQGKFMSLQFTPADAQEANRTSRSSGRDHPPGPHEDDIPF